MVEPFLTGNDGFLEGLVRLHGLEEDIGARMGEVLDSDVQLGDVVLLTGRRWRNWFRRHFRYQALITVG
jgi:hypothetical protein